MSNKKIDRVFVKNMEKIFDPISVSMILVDGNGKVLMINDAFANFLKKPKKELIGKSVTKIDANTRFPYVIKNKKAEIAWKHRFSNGHTAIVHRIPVLDDDGEVEYGFGMVLFNDIQELKDLVKKNKLLGDKLSYYKEQLREIQGAKYSWDSIVGNSDIMLYTKDLAKRAAKSSSNVLILGESGTGKELFAHAIHMDSTRSIYPFVKVNCAAIPKDLLESELFGYEEGAFTGAKKSGKTGKFELANHGTIFLDEIGDMPLTMQAKLLRVLQEREIEKLGSNKIINLDVRVVAATNQQLKEKVENKEFREDLYYRLNVMSLELPPLRNHAEDVESMTYKMIDKLSESMGVLINTISPEAVKALSEYKWPGNARELENIVERAINLVDSDEISINQLPYYISKNEDIKEVKVESKIKDIENIKPLNQVIEKAERKAIKECLEITKNNKLKTSKLLNISRTSLYEKIEKYNLL